MDFRSRAAALSLLCWMACAPAQGLPDAARAEFRVALDHVAQPEPAADSAALRGYLLYPYLEAARLRQELSRVPGRQRLAGLDRRVRAFLERQGEVPVTRDLSRDWLGYLGERAAWAEFQQSAPANLTELPLRCHALTARLVRKELKGLREAALELWLTQRDAPPACVPVFRWIDSAAHLSAAEIEQRARFAAANGVPLPAAAAGLPPARRALLRYWDRLMAQPERELRLYLAGERAAELPALPDPDIADALLEAFVRVSKRDSRQAALLYEPLQQLPFSEEQHARLRRDHALGLAYDFDAQALAVFREVPDAALETIGHEWRVRAALWHRDWDLALRWLEAMPEPQRHEPRWRYWQARMLERRNQREQARERYEGVAREREYYAFLAAERLGRKPDLRPQPLAANAALQQTLAAEPAMQRARELFRCELPALATAELRYALRERGTEDKAQAAGLVAGWGWYEPAVRLLSETQRWDDLGLRFPLPYDREIDAAAKDTRLPGEWLYTVLRTESLYDPRAVSPVGALGLLQLMLPTARQVARRSGLPAPQRDDLFRPEVNIALGARYLRELLERFDQRFVLTLAAYNAGPQRVPDWLPQQAVEADIWIENIPYNETRTYVQRALSSLVILSWRRTGNPVRLAPLLQPVVAPPQQASAS